MFIAQGILPQHGISFEACALSGCFIDPVFIYAILKLVAVMKQKSVINCLKQMEEKEFIDLTHHAETVDI